MKRYLFVVAVALSICAMLSSPDAARAHVGVSPDEVPSDSNQVFVVEVPNESDVPVTKLELLIPEGFEATGVNSSAGFQGGIEEDSVVWSGGQVPVGETGEFVFEAHVPVETGEFAFEAFQTYQDGEVAEWTGPASSQEPAPVVKVFAGQTTAGGTDEPQRGGEETEARQQDRDTLPDTGSPNRVVLIGLIGLGVLTLCAAAATISRLASNRS